MSTERIDIELVDEGGEVKGLAEKYEVHKNPVPLHRAVSVVIVDESSEKMLIQQRAGDKSTWPLFWSNAVCTHPLPKEEFKTAAERRLREELGFSVPLQEVFRFTYQAEYDKTWGENEYDVVFLGKYGGDVRPDHREVSDFKWVDIGELKEDVKENPDLFSPWFKIILEKLNIV